MNMQNQLFWRSMNSNSPDRLTETDSGQWSSSFPSSPIKEQSPVHQTGPTNTPTHATATQRQTTHPSSSKKSQLYGTPDWADWEVDDENSDQNEVMLTSLTSQSSSSMTASRQNSHEILRATPPPSNQHHQQQQQQTQPQVQNPKSMAFVIDFNNESSDVKSENGTYTLDDEPREPVDLCSGNGDSHYNGDGVIGNNSGIQDSWIVKWASEAAKYNNNETKEILSETEKIVESMQNRVTNVQRSKSNLSPSVAKKYPASSMTKFNRAFNIRRTLNTNSSNASYESDGSGPPSIPPVNDNNGHFSRSDGGRFSLRMGRGEKKNYHAESDPEGRATIPINRLSRPSISPSPYRSTSQKPPTVPSNKLTSVTQTTSSSPSHKTPPTASSSSSLSKKPNVRSNSTMSSRDVELAENWRRRKSYDPLRSSGMLNQKGNCSISNMSSANEFKEPSSSSNSLTNERKKSLTDNQRTLSVQDSSSSSLNRKKEFLKRSSVTKPISNPPPSPTTSKGSTLVPQQCCGKPRNESAAFSCGEEHGRVFAEYKNHHYQMQGHLEQRKFEALDTLVISTIHSLSTKVRNLSLNLLKKIQPTYGEDENGALLEEMVTQLTELSQSQTCNNTTSKELSGTLKNIKKLEQVVLVLDRVLCDQDSSAESED